MQRFSLLRFHQKPRGPLASAGTAQRAAWRRETCQTGALSDGGGRLIPRFLVEPPILPPLTPPTWPVTLGPPHVGSEHVGEPLKSWASGEGEAAGTFTT